MTGASISVRLPEETKKKMKKLDIDWAEYIRKAVEDKIKEERRKKAAASADMIRAKTKRGDFDSTKSIREDRDG